MNTISKNDKKLKQAIWAVSIVIPIAVAILFTVKIEGLDLGFLPPIYASLNALTAIGLIVAIVAIKRKNRKLHQKVIQVCLIFSILFLLLYVLYHMTSDTTPYGGEGILKMIYFFLLISHILLSMVVIPIVLFAYLFAWQGDFVRHKKWTKFAFPLWLYVAVTGVLVYVMISPYY
jgi:putative membrane protein